jgi:hypothetical protein
MVAFGRVLASTFASRERTETFQLLVIFSLVGMLTCLFIANYGGNLDVDWPEINF